MKTAEQWAEEFPILVPQPLDFGMSKQSMEFKREYRERYLNFIREIQLDAMSEHVVNV